MWFLRDLCLLAGSGVKAEQCWAVGFLVAGALGRAFPHVHSLVPGKWRARAAALPPARVPLLNCLVSWGLQELSSTFPSINASVREHTGLVFFLVCCLLAVSLRVLPSSVVGQRWQQ